MSAGKVQSPRWHSPGCGHDVAAAVDAELLFEPVSEELVDELLVDPLLDDPLLDELEARLSVR